MNTDSLVRINLAISFRISQSGRLTFVLTYLVVLQLLDARTAILSLLLHYPFCFSLDSSVIENLLYEL